MGRPGRQFLVRSATSFAANQSSRDSLSADHNRPSDLSFTRCQCLQLERLERKCR
eukprot:gene8333-6013_t